MGSRHREAAVSAGAFRERQQSALGEVRGREPRELRVPFPLHRHRSGEIECNYKKLVTGSEKDSDY